MKFQPGIFSNCIFALKCSCTNFFTDNLAHYLLQNKIVIINHNLLKIKKIPLNPLSNATSVKIVNRVNGLPTTRRSTTCSVVSYFLSTYYLFFNLLCRLWICTSNIILRTSIFMLNMKVKVILYIYYIYNIHL